MTRSFCMGRRNAQGTLPSQPIPLLATLAVVVFAVEFGVMLVLPWLGLPEGSAEAIVDASLLTILCLPGIYLLAVRPLRKAAGLLRESNDVLETCETERAADLMKVNDRLQQEVAEGRLTKKALGDSEAAFRDLFENATDLIQMVSPDGRFQYVNRTWRETLGYREGEVASLSVFDIIHPDYQDHCEEIFNRLMAGETVRNVGTVFVTKDGKPITVDGNINCRMEDGKPVATRGIFRDITERVRIEEALHIRTMAMEAAGEAILVSNRDGIIEYVNPAFTTVTGYSPDETVGQKPSVLKSGKQDVSFYQTLWDTILAGKVWRGELVNRRKDGSLYSEEMTISPVKDARGRVVRFIAIKRDFTDRKRAEQALRESEERLNLALEGADDGIWDWNATTGEVVFNERWAAMLGYELSEIEPHIRSWENLVHPDDMPRVMEALTAHLDSHTPFYQSEHRLRTKSGEWKWILDRGKVVARDEDGKPLRATGTHKDITERKRADAELEALHKQLLTTSHRAGMAEAAAGVLHNVGNVLNSVNVSATVVADRVRRSKVSGLVKAVDLIREHSEDLETFIVDDEKGKRLPGYLIKLAEHLVDEQKDMVEEIHSLTDNIEHIKQIVSVQQSYAGVSGVTEPVRLTDLLEDALKINMAGLERHGIEIAREYSELSPIVLDKHRLLQILINLLSNAKYAMSETTRPDKKLTLRIGMSDDQRVHIEVADNGVGITEENLTRIFSHGFTTKKGGHGFGLHNSALAATEMGGSLTVHSDGPGKGATFSLELPPRPEEVAS